jgi:hypothetical protein
VLKCVWNSALLSVGTALDTVGVPTCFCLRPILIHIQCCVAFTSLCSVTAAGGGAQLLKVNKQYSVHQVAHT